MRAIVFGIAASFFFAFTFILNRSMDLGGGSWIWSASLRFFFMAPLLFLLLLLPASGNAGGGPSPRTRESGTAPERRKPASRLRKSLLHLRAHWPAYLLWSTVGFGLFYAPLSFAGSFGPGWLVAGTWQLTIIAGPLLTPFILSGKNASIRQIPFQAMRWSLLILAGVLLMQWEHARDISARQAMFCALPIILAAFMYPLGNRLMMKVCQDEVDAFQRVFNMTLASLPFWLGLAAWGLCVHGRPSKAQLLQSALVAVFSGVIATLLFFSATNQVRQNPHRLAAVEATQSGEVLFALAGEIILLSAAFPSAVSLLGILLVIAGMVLHSLRQA